MRPFLTYLVITGAVFLWVSGVYAERLPQELEAPARAGTQLSSFAELRDFEVVRQSLDFSCGAAALATLMTFQWHDPVSERDILETLSRITSTEELSRRRSSGFTLLDLQQVARSRGYQAQGFRMKSPQLAKLKGPVIVFIEPYGYKHFAVLRGVVGGRAVLADPSRGNITVPLYRFLDWWEGDGGDGIIFAVEPLYATAATVGAGGMRLQPGEGYAPALMDVRSLLPAAALSSPGRMLAR